VRWKNDPDKKPLLIYGARQIGKTHSIMDFAAKNYSSVAYFYFENNPDLYELFERGISSIKSLIPKLEAYANQANVPES